MCRMEYQQFPLFVREYSLIPNKHTGLHPVLELLIKCNEDLHSEYACIQKDDIV